MEHAIYSSQNYLLSLQYLKYEKKNARLVKLLGKCLSRDEFWDVYEICFFS